MNLTGNTILITGGGSGIGLGLAREFHQRGNQVIIAGRRQSALGAATDANPGMKSIVLDTSDPASIASAVAAITREYPTLNAVLNNAGIMRPEDIKAGATTEAESIIATNLLGPIRLTAALMPHLLKPQPTAPPRPPSTLTRNPSATNSKAPPSRCSKLSRPGSPPN
jgi:uncharacterized oxidoreductase